MESSKIGKINRGTAGKGRPKGSPNKNTKALKDMILGALEDAGGQAFLLKQARKKNNTPFMILIGKVLPMAVTLGNDESKKFVLEVSFPPAKDKESIK